MDKILENQEEITENQEQKNDFFLYPCKMSKRILAFLADGFIAFILAILLFEVAFLPIVNACRDYTNITNSYYQTINERYDYLYSHDLMTCNTETEKYIYSTAFRDTATNFLKYYVYDNNIDYKKYEVVSHYFIDIKGKNQEFLATTIYKKATNEVFQKYFNCADGTFEISLKSEFKDLFIPFYTEGDTISADGEKEMNNVISKFFEGEFYVMFNDFDQTDETFHAFNVKINEYNEYRNLNFIIAAFVTFFISSVVCFLVVPLIDKRGRTIGKIIMKIERIKKNNFKVMDLKNKFLVYALSTVEILPILMFIPWISAGFAGIFNLQVLLYPSLIGVTYCLISLLVAVITNFRQSFKELASGTVIVLDELMDELYVKLGYDL